MWVNKEIARSLNENENMSFVKHGAGASVMSRLEGSQQNTLHLVPITTISWFETHFKKATLLSLYSLCLSVTSVWARPFGSNIDIENSHQLFCTILAFQQMKTHLFTTRHLFILLTKLDSNQDIFTCKLGQQQMAGIQKVETGPDEMFLIDIQSQWKTARPFSFRDLNSGFLLNLTKFLSCRYPTCIIWVNFIELLSTHLRHNFLIACDCHDCRNTTGLDSPQEVASGTTALEF